MCYLNSYLQLGVCMYPCFCIHFYHTMLY